MTLGDVKGLLKEAEQLDEDDELMATADENEGDLDNLTNKDHPAKDLLKKIGFGSSEDNAEEGKNNPV